MCISIMQIQLFATVMREYASIGYAKANIWLNQPDYMIAAGISMQKRSFPDSPLSSHLTTTLI